MTMYQPNIPTGLVNLDEDYLNLLHNFQQLDTSFGINHIKYSVAPNNGKHTFVEMPISSGIPTPLTGSEGTLYTKTSSAVSELFYTPDNSGNQYQLTRTISASFTKFGNSTAYTANHTGGWTFLPGGLILQYGIRTNISGSASGAITFPIVFPSGLAPFSITQTLKRTSGRPVAIDSAVAVTASGYSYQLDSTGSVAIQWMAIGN